MTTYEIISDGGRRRRWSHSEKLRIVEESLGSSDSISSVARRNGVAPNLLYRWRQLIDLLQKCDFWVLGRIKDIVGLRVLLFFWRV